MKARTESSNALLSGASRISRNQNRGEAHVRQDNGAPAASTAKLEHAGSAAQGTAIGPVRKRAVQRRHRSASMAGLIIEDASAAIMPGNRVLLVGETGAGKSTLFRVVAGLCGVRKRSSRRAPVGFTSPLMAANRGYGQGCRIARRYLGKCPFFDQDHILRFVNTGANFLNMTEHRLVHCVRSTKTSFDISCSGLIYRKDAMWIIP